MPAIGKAVKAINPSTGKESTGIIIAELNTRKMYKVQFGNDALYVDKSKVIFIS